MDNNIQRVGANSSNATTAATGNSSMTSFTPSGSTLISAAANSNGVIIRSLVCSENNNNQTWGVITADNVRIAAFQGISGSRSECITQPILVPPGQEVEVSTFRACKVTITWDDLP